MVRPRLDRYKQIEEFMMNNKGHSASPQQLRAAIGIECTKLAMSHYVRYMKKRQQLFEINGRYFLPHQLPMEMIK